MARFCTRENEPLKKWNGVPIYLTTIIVAVMAAGLLFSAILQSLRSPLIERLTFILPGNDLNWLAAFTYPLIDRLSFFTPLSILFLYRLSVGIETHLGRAVLTRLFAILVLLPVAFACAMWWGFSVEGWLRGNWILFMGLLIAFSTVYPNAEFCGWIPFKWLAFACLVCGSMMELSDRDWVTLASLWGCAGAAFLYMRRAVDAEHDDHVPVVARVRQFFRKKPKLRVVPPPVPSARPVTMRSSVPDSVELEMDALLDKIAKTGLASLSNAERAKLERARQELLKKEQA
jgi:hypothetical protein